MYLNDPAQVLEVSFKVKYENGYYAVYASSGNMKCFDCGDVGHKRSSCLHKGQAAGSGTGEQQAAGSSTGEQQAEDHAGSSGPLAAQNYTREIVTGTPHPDTLLKETTENSEVSDRNSGNVEAKGVEDNEGSGQTEGGESDIQTAEAESGAAGELNTVNVEKEEEEEMLEDDSLSQFSDIVSQDDKQPYSVQEINYFLDEIYGRQSVDITDFFPDVDRFINSVLKIRKLVGYEQLTKQKRFRLKKLLTKLRKEKRGKAPINA